ncbi:sigma-54-dependent Fis family transcriptional regulator [Sinorhizobium saheli]|uniref:Fis family transcriptional regulator n=1 Tax=Sinorhizobium saheli TaxID=36856 RepID=A0A178YTU7_SINSA|nr:sigma-54-dependent Fis family transcriptional regulator [Sinorhizobium saheli]MQW88221.1 sigma-54-dependent Fis family transcriptional regulator [Sinorhizobium saheli]OAP50175.1 Fis family transcriptional regulator [Sinorhizobium saheli]
MLEINDHFRVIERAVLSGSEKTNWRTESWARCLQDYKLDPSRANLVELTQQEIREQTDAFDNDIALAAGELESTLGMIEGGGYSAHLANRNGVIIAERKSRDSAFYLSSDRVGMVWTEEVGGTNGIGTSLKQLTPTAVYLTDHFFADLTGGACAAAPFFGPDGTVLGIVNLSTRNPGLPQLAHRVVFGVAQITAERLETSYFTNHFRRFYTLVISLEQKSPAIIAVDSDFKIVGATRHARAAFRLDDAIGTRSLWGVFEKIRGNPTIEYLCENLRELRPLGSGQLLGVSLKRPLTLGALANPKIAPGAKSAPAKPARKITTLAECAGEDPQMKRNLSILKKVFGSGLHVLLLGETGVGKDTLTRALHYESERATGPFVAFNCSAVPESLIDSELFGYSGGAFTGANKEGNLGRIVEADKGTLFLDEIGDMPLQLQTRLLRFLETQEVMPLGSGKVRTVDVQVVAATHQNLHEKVAAGSFRQDLFYRLAGTIITIPSLRERSDLDYIIRTLLDQLAEDEPVRLSEAARKALLGHSWPGNIRELRNVLTRAAKLADGGVINVDDLMLVQVKTKAGPLPALHEIRPKVPETPQANPQPQPIPAMPGRAKVVASQAERSAIIAAIEASGGGALACAAALGVSRATLYRKLKQYDLSLTLRSRH